MSTRSLLAAAQIHARKQGSFSLPTKTYPNILYAHTHTMNISRCRALVVRVKERKLRTVVFHLKINYKSET